MPDQPLDQNTSRKSGRMISPDTRALIACILIVMLANLPLLRGNIHLTFDTIFMFYPWHDYLRTLPAEATSAWLPLVGCGMPADANGQLGHFMPLNFPFHLPISTASAFVAATLLCFIVAAMGTYLLCRSYAARRSSSLLAATAFATMGGMLAHVDHLGLIGAACFMPFMWYAARRAAREGGLRWLAVSAIAVAMGFISSFPQAAVMGALSAAVLYLFELRLAGTCTWPRAVGSSALYLGGLGFIGIALGAVQALPMYELARHSVRADISGWEFATSYSLPLTHLIRFVVPNFFGANDATYHGAWNHQELHPYVGLLPLLLALWALFRVRNRNTLIIGLILGISVLLALGGSTPIYRLLYRLPFFGTFRAPARWVLAAGLAIAVLSALGLDRLLGDLTARVAARWSRGLFIAAAVFAAVYLAAFLLQPSAVGWMDTLVAQGMLPTPDAPSGADLSARLAFAYEARILAPASTMPYTAAALLLAAVGMACVKRWGTRLTRGFFLAGMVLEAALFGCTYNAFVPASVLDYRPPVTAPMKHLPESGRYYYEQDPDLLAGRAATDALVAGNPAVADYVVPRPNRNLSFGIASFGTYDPLELANWRRLADLLKPHIHHPGVAAFAGIEYAAVSEQRARDFAEWEEVNNWRGMVLLRNPRYRGLGWVCMQQALEETLPQRLAADNTHELFATAYMPDDYVLRPPAKGPIIISYPIGPQVAVRRWDHSAIEVDVFTPYQESTLVITSTYYPGWSATIDGAAAELFPVNIAFTGVSIPEGTHHVKLMYRNRMKVWGAYISLIAVLLCAVAIALGRPRRIPKHPD
jgi:hypothetical protein